MSDSDDSNLQQDSDTELQEAFAKGLLKPGLNIVEERITKKYANVVPLLKQKLQEITLPLDWIERLDMVNTPAPLAPELAVQLTEHKERREATLKQKKKNTASIEDDMVHNDFKRELVFLRQAQAAVMMGLPRLHKLGILTQRPKDYFAQMAKSDDHMQKVRGELLKQKTTKERTEKIRKVRELRKFGKKVQVEVQQQRHREKRKLAEEVKKFQKGKRKDLDFLENRPKAGKKTMDKNPARSKKDVKKLKYRKQMKNSKYGFGGPKRGSKKNTQESTADFSGKNFKRSGSANTGNMKLKRPGKNRRQQMRNRKK